MRIGLAPTVCFLLCLLGASSSSADSPLLQTGHLHAITDVAISPDSTRVATASASGEVIVWDLATRQVQLRLPRGGTRLAFSPDGDTLASGGGDVVKFWRLADGALVHQWSSADTIFDVEYHPDGKQLLLSLGNEAGYAVINPADSDSADTQAGAPPRHPDDSANLALAHFSPNGQILGVLRDNVVTVYSWPERAELGRFDLKFEDISGYYPVESFAFSPDSRQILLGSWVEVDNGDYLTALWDIASGKRIATRSLQHNCDEVGFTPDGREAWAGRAFWQLEGNAPTRPLPNPQSRSDYDRATISSDGRWHVGGSQSGEVAFWEVASGRLVDHVPPSVAAPRQIEFSNDGTTMLVNFGEAGYATGNSGRKFSALFTFAPHQAIAHPDRPPFAVEGILSADGAKLALHNGLSGLRQMKISEGQLIEAHQLAIGSTNRHSGRDHIPMAFDSSARRLIAGSHQRSPRFHLESSPDYVSHAPAVIYDTQTGKVTTTLTPVAPEGVLSVALSPDGTLAATGVIGDKVSRVSRVLVIDVSSGEIFRETSFHGRYSPPHLRFTLDGKLAVVAFRDSLRSHTLLWNYTNDEVVQSFTVGGPMALRPGSNEAVIYGPWGNPRRVDMESGETLGHIEQRDIVNPGQFDREGGVMLCDDQNRIDLFDSFTGELLTRFGIPNHLQAAYLSADAGQIVACSDNYRVTIWKKSDGGWKYRKVSEHQMPSGRLLAIKPDAEKFVYRINDHETKTSRVALVDATTGEQLGEFEGARDVAAFSPDGKTLFSYGAHWSWHPETTISLYDAQTCQLVRKLELGPWEVEEATFHPDGDRLLVSCELDLSKQLADDPENETWQTMALDWEAARLWDARTGQQVRTFAGHRWPVTDLVFSPDGKRLLTTSFDRTNLWDVETGERLFQLEIDGDTHRQSLAVDSALTRLAARVGSQCQLWDLNSQHELTNFELPGDWSNGWCYLAFSDGGEWLVVGNEQVTLLARWGDDAVTSLDFDSPVVSATFRPGYSQLATCHVDGSVRLSQVPSGKEIARFYRLEEGQEWIAITSEGWVDGSPRGLSRLGWKHEGQPLDSAAMTQERHQPERVRSAIGGVP